MVDAAYETGNITTREYRIFLTFIEKQFSNFRKTEKHKQ